MKKITLNMSAVAIGLIGWSAAANAVTYTWTSNSDTNWSNAANWDGGAVPASLADATRWAPTADSIVFSGSVVPTTNIPSFNTVGYDAIPMTFNSGGSFTLDLSSSFNGSLWTNAAREQITVGDGSNAFTLNINNMAYFARSGQEITYVVNDGSTLNINGNLNEYPDNGVKKGIFDLDGGNMVVDGVATGNGTLDFDDNAVFNFSDLGGSLTMDLGGTVYAALTDVTGDFGTVFQSDLGVGALSAVDNLDGTFTVTAVPEPGTYALLGGFFALVCVMLRRRR